MAATGRAGCGTIEVEDAVDDVYFDGDPAKDSTRRRLERVLNAEPPPRWPWLAALAAGSTALMFWQIRRRRKNGLSAKNKKEASVKDDLLKDDLLKDEPAPRRG